MRPLALAATRAAGMGGRSFSFTTNQFGAMHTGEALGLLAQRGLALMASLPLPEAIWMRRPAASQLKVEVP